MSKTLILCGNADMYFFPNINSCEIDVFSAYQNAHAYRIPKKIYKIFPKLRWLTLGKLESWSKKINEYDKVILFDSAYDYRISNFLKKHSFRDGAFIFYWNKLGSEQNVNLMLKREQSYFSIYSYDPEDCQKYNLTFNTTTYCANQDISRNEKYQYEVVFLGRNKEREGELNTLIKFLNNNKITSFFYVVGQEKTTNNGIISSDKLMSYSEYINYVYNCRAIVDILQPIQKGCSLRTMEALYYKKKLITNKLEIKEQPFYNSNNIFILGEDEIQKLPEFIKSSYLELPTTIYNIYNIDNWTSRFKRTKTLFLVSDKNRYFFPYINNINIIFDQIWNGKFWEKNLLLKRIFRKIKMPFSFQFGKWKNNINNFSKIIILDGAYDKLIYYYLNKKTSIKDIFVYCWNSKERLKHVMDSPFEIYTFDKSDAKELEIYYLHTFYSKDVVLKKKQILYDILFVGTLKNRGSEINEIYEFCKSINLIVKFHIVGKSTKFKNIELAEKHISYTEYLELISSAKAILDIVDQKQNGLSMRVMESIFLEKKLITNNKSILNEKFYHSNNIFVLGINNLQDIREFMEKQYQVIDKEIVDEYEIQNWIRKIGDI